MTRPLGIALLGCGSVGTQVARLLTERRADLEARIGAPVELVGIAVRRPELPRSDVPDALLTGDADALVRRDDVDVVIELIGGVEPARSLILAALEAGASVVTANKALVAADGARLHRAAAAAGRDLFFEAAVAGAIPIIRPLRESLAGDRVRSVLGIVNGTANYVLDQMDSHGVSFDEALAAAQSLGYAEADPAADIEGFDAADKAAILASIAFHTRVSVADVHREGISDVTAEAISSAREIDAVVKLLAICEAEQSPEGTRVSARVHPAMIPRHHPLASVHEAFNAVFVESESAGQLMFYGPGAGGTPTASAVLGDLVTVAHNRLNDVVGVGESTYAEVVVAPMGETVTRYHVAMEVDDKPGVLASVAELFARRDISIQTVRQVGRGDEARLVVVTHSAPDAALAATVDGLRSLPSVRAVTSVTRVEAVAE